MVYQYSTLLINSFFDAVLAQMRVAGVATLNIYDSEGAVIVTMPFAGEILKSRSPMELELNNPQAAQAQIDAIAATASIVNGSNQVIVTFDVGSPNTNPDAVLILSSTTIFMGGTVTVSRVRLVS